MPQVRFLPMEASVQVPQGTRLTEAARLAGIGLSAPCGGRGSCGKCRVELDGRSVLACQTLVTRDMAVRVPEQALQILSDPGSLDAHLSPPVSLRREGDQEAVVRNGQVLALRRAGLPFLAAAADLGTTTLVLYLLDARTGALLSTKSAPNPQRSFGADVISRVDYALRCGPERLTALLREAVNQLLREALAEAGAREEDLFSLSIAGNSCMHHLFLGVCPEGLAAAPYALSVTGLLEESAASLSLAMHPQGRVFLLPCIAGFVGADTAALLLRTDFDRLESPTLAVDVGTNGELALGDSSGFTVCSAAAGPAFEGAGIACGVPALTGAVAHASLRGGELSLQVLGGGTPCGICGSGLMDLLALLLDAGLMDATGRLLAPEELTTPLARRLGRRLTMLRGEPIFVLFSEAETGCEAVYLSQGDIRTLQLAKAALRAGIELLLADRGYVAEELSYVLLAGAFGSALDPRSACRIGLLPPALAGRIRPIGNAAGAGAVQSILDQDALARIQNLAGAGRYLELADAPEFQSRFFSAMDFPADA